MTDAALSLEPLLQKLQSLEQRLATLEHDRMASRILNGLESASKIHLKSRTVIFIGRDYFGDNVKYAFLAFQNQAQALGIRVYYLTESEAQYRLLNGAGLPCLPWTLTDWTTEHMHIMLETKVAVIGSVFYPSNERTHLFWSLLRGAKIVQLWHGIPLKQIGLECLYTPATFGERAAELLAASGPFDVFVGASSKQHDEWRKRFAFHVYAACGYPRTDVLLRTTIPADLINIDEKAYGMVTGSKKPVILYAPTFRDHRLGVWFHDADIERLAADCAVKGSTLLVNLHPFEHRWLGEFQARYPTIHFVAANTDIYPVLKHVDLLITDYSSIFFDFLLLDRPVVFYRPDHADYIAHARGLIDGHEQYICGEVTEGMEELIVALSKAQDTDLHKSTREKLTAKLYDFRDSKASERFTEVLRQQVEN